MFYRSRILDIQKLGDNAFIKMEEKITHFSALGEIKVKYSASLSFFGCPSLA